jgi:hypothetical protein
VTIPEGFLGIDLDGIIDPITKLLPPVVAEAIQNTLGKILDPDHPDLNVGDPQPAGPPPIPVAADSKELSAAVKAIDAAVGAIELVLKLAFLIPDQYESPLRALAGALRTIRGWLD